MEILYTLVFIIIILIIIKIVRSRLNESKLDSNQDYVSKNHYSESFEHPETDLHLDDILRDIIRSQGKLSAIKYLKDTKSMDLKSAKAHVDSL